jgi:hypothetical protein
MRKAQKEAWPISLGHEKHRVRYDMQLYMHCVQYLIATGNDSCLISVRHQEAGIFHG